MNDEYQETQRILKLSQLYIEQGKPIRALETLDHAGGAAQEHWNYWYNRAWVLLELKRYKEGIEAARKGLWLAPELPSLFWMLALNQDGAGEVDHARVSLWQGLRKQPENIFLLTESAWIEGRLGQWEKATTHQRYAEQLAPFHRKVKINQLRLAGLQNDLPEVRRIAEGILAEEPENGYALLMLGMVAKDEGALGEAEKQLRRVVLNKPSESLLVQEVRTVQLLRHPLFYPLTWVRKIPAIPLCATFFIIEEWFRLSGDTTASAWVVIIFCLYWLYVIIGRKLLKYLSQRKR
jgi:tetratricopeptide (TPR) repeat protein